MAFEKATVGKGAAGASLELLKNMGINVSAGVVVELLKKIIGF